MGELKNMEEILKKLNINDTSVAHQAVPIKYVGPGKYEHSFNIPKVLYESVIGPDGMGLKNIEKKTRTTIKFPATHAKEQDIVITGADRPSVQNCREQLNQRIKYAKKNVRYTHLITIPLNTEMVVSNYEKFKSKVLNDSAQLSNGINEGLFSNSKRLHITVGRLCLQDDQAKEKAVTTLKACMEEVIEPFVKELRHPVVIKIQGFVSKKQTTDSKTFGLFGKVLHTEDIRNLKHKVSQFFTERGFELVNYPMMRMHMPLIKAVRRIKTGQHNSCDKRLQPFNATKILRVFGEYDFGEVTLKTVSIVEIASGDDNGNYLLLAKEDLSS